MKNTIAQLTGKKVKTICTEYSFSIAGSINRETEMAVRQTLLPSVGIICIYRYENKVIFTKG